MKLITTLTGPSCAGKSTLENMLAERGCMKAISTTTRAPRIGEVDGVDYYFVSHDKFRTLRDCGMFVEHVEFGGNHYGLTTAEVERLFMQGNHIAIVCEPVGAKQISKWCKARTDILLRQVFVDNPASVISERFLRRFHQDMPSRGFDTGSLSDKTIEAYAKRLTTMQTVERGWIAEAYGPCHPMSHHQSDPFAFQYDILIERFDESNCEQIASDLIHAIV